MFLIFINRSHFISFMICIAVFLNYITQFINLHICDSGEVIYLLTLFFKVLINLSGTADFLHYALNTFLYFYFIIMISIIWYKAGCFYQPIFCLVCIQIHLEFSEKFQSSEEASQA